MTSHGDNPTTKQALTGWGGTAPTSAAVTRAHSVDELAAAVDRATERGVIARGLGRSYGDEAQNAGGQVVDATRVTGLVDLDRDRGVARALAGTSLDHLMHELVPQGFFVPVTPGTRYVTVGGAIANDIHGKNHHRSGSWCDHVSSFTLHTPVDGTIAVTPASDPDLFWATAGGLGLTGVVLDATFDLHPIETSWIRCDTVRTGDLDEVMELMSVGDDDYEYSVAWIDLMARGRSLGRSILDRGRFATLDELTPAKRRRPLDFSARPRLAAPPLVPPRVLNRLTVRAFNEVWYRKAPRRRDGHLVRIGSFFHPLDAVANWNRVYGPAGFVQWQMVVPFGAEAAVRSIVDTLSTTGCTSFLAVLKRFGPANRGHLSFPMAGWTLALDIPAEVRGLAGLLDRLDEQVVGVGGRIYLAKDSRVSPALLPRMYPRLDEWRSVRRRVDPEGVLQSDMARRLGLG